MSLNAENYSIFFPKKVFRCPCLLSVIDDCHENDLNSFVEIYEEVVHFSVERGLGKIFAMKCGEELNDCIFCCHNCVSVIILGMKDYDCTDTEMAFDNLTIFFNKSETSVVGKTFCKGCIKHYLRKPFTYFYFKEF